MVTSKMLSSKNVFFGNNLYFFVAVACGGLLFAPIDAYVASIGIHEDEAVATAVSVTFMLAVFAGRYIVQVWASKLTVLPKVFLAGVAITLLVCGIWIFFHIYFAFGRRSGMVAWLPFTLIGIASGALVKVIHAVTQNQLRQAQGEAAHNKSELHLLQSQLSPHFLFNTLNNVYGLSLTDHQKVPSLLLKLSELLRYSVYDVGETYVRLADEMVYINNYIAFERLRIGDRLSLTLDMEEMVDPEIKIAPMLLIVFLENAFKHSKNTSGGQIFIHISLKTWENSILFSVKNTYGSDAEASSLFNGKNSGFGLQNVKKRLSLLYAGANELHISKDEIFYKVALQLKTING
ncbi:MAG: histidine kinase [Mucilaginibacter sp.]|nr:histidine kinase [Mucilaginibacter sp.]